MENINQKHPQVQSPKKLCAMPVLKCSILLICITFFLDCKEDELRPSILPSIIIQDPTYVGPFEATLNEELTLLGTQPIMDHGFIFSVNEIKTLNDGTKVAHGSLAEPHKVSAAIDKLIKEQKYFVRGYATTNDTTVFSEQISFTTAQVNQWITLQTLPDFSPNEVNNAGYEINHKGYVGFGLGGESEKTQFLPLHEYDPSTHTWNILIKCPAPYRNHCSSFAIGDSIYVGMGDIDVPYPYFPQTDLWTYNITSKKWRRNHDFPITTYVQKAFGMGGRGYVVGRESTSSQAVLMEYVPQLGRWYMQPNTPGGVSLFWIHCAFGFNGKGFVLGQEPSRVPFLWTFDPNNYQWKKFSPPPDDFILEDPTALTTSTKIFVIAYNPASLKRHLWEYIIANDAWTDKGELPFPFRSAFTINDRIYAPDASTSILYMYVPQ
jgi:hypothetical protein